LGTSARRSLSGDSQPGAPKRTVRRIRGIPSRQHIPPRAITQLSLSECNVPVTRTWGGAPMAGVRLDLFR
jgi:hypothetical protein